MKKYQAKNGSTQYKPSFDQLMELSDGSGGFCVACGAEHDCVEPDARRYHCTCCNEHKVYGAEELILMNLYHN
jgi:hypothetical protein